MLALIINQKTKFGFGEIKKNQKITRFPYTTIVQETHLMEIGVMSIPITRKHERLVKVLNEHEVYVYKNPDQNCSICAKYYGLIKGENINMDPFVGKVFAWNP